MTVSLVIAIVCLVLFMVITVFLCIILLKRRNKEIKKDGEGEKDLESDSPKIRKSSIQAPKRRKRKCSIKSDFYTASEKNSSNLLVPFNSPDPRTYKKKHFQPMNDDERRKRKKEKRKKERNRTRNKHKSIKNDHEYNSHIPVSKRAEYYNSEVEVVPLKFSDKNYTKNYITESLFAGSIHRGSSCRDFELSSSNCGTNSEEGYSPRIFVPWRQLFEEKMNNDK